MNNNIFHEVKTTLIVFKKSIFVFIALCAVILINFSGCGDDKSPTISEESYFITVTFGSSSRQVNLAELNRETIDGEEAVKLTDLVDISAVIYPQNHAYRFIGEDGFYAHIKGNPDNTWEQIQSGYILLTSMNTTFDPSLELPSRYNIKNTAEMKILRKIDIVTPADSLIQFIIDEMTQIAFEDTLTGIPLTGFVSTDIIDNPSAHAYDLVAADDYTVTISYEQFMEGFYIIEYDRILYTNPDISSKLKIKHLNRIIIFNPLD